MPAEIPLDPTRDRLIFLAALFEDETRLPLYVGEVGRALALDIREWAASLPPVVLPSREAVEAAIETYRVRCELWGKESCSALESRAALLALIPTEN